MTTPKETRTDQLLRAGVTSIDPWADALRHTERELTALRTAYEAALETAAEDAAASWDTARAAEQRAAELQRRMDRVEQVCNDESQAAWEKYKFGGPAEQGNPYWEGFSDGAEQVLAAISAQPNAAAERVTGSLPPVEGEAQNGTPAPSAAPVAHSKSQYRRLVAQGADVAPPDAALPGLELAAGICDNALRLPSRDEYEQGANDMTTYFAKTFRAEIKRRKQTAQASDWPFKVLE